MRHTTLSSAIAEAERFLKAARKLQQVDRQDPVDALCPPVATDLINAIRQAA